MTATGKRHTRSDETVAYMTQLIDDHGRHLKARGFAKNTVESRLYLLHRLDGELPMGLGQATVEELEHFLSQFDDNQTQATYHGHICGFFRWAADPKRPRIDYDPTAGLLRPKVPRGLPKPATNDQLQHALNTLSEPWRLYVKLAAYAGARCCEIVTLDREDFTVESTRIIGKGGKVRVLRTHPIIWTAIEPLPAGPIARRVRTGDRAQADYLSAIMIYQLRRAGLAGLSLHRFRHWNATTQLKPVKYGGAGASIRAVQENLGHEQLSSTAIYTLVTDEERADAIDSLPVFVAPPSW